uniref:Small ribosomal subunit protein uS3m n=1 Tax=Imshaugia aleurites TaxID=172621 RepID=A0A220T565_9LECA|nr:ribosomal protein subunit 3 [Imshaugia aleurites]ASK50780.1 ribosomal protein subunit 3 [Imshaugia aleurites]
MLNIFNARSKKDNTQKVKLENNYNYIGRPRHYPPANKEWFNSIYVYNNNTIKLLPTVDKVTLKLVKSYFNFYSRKLEKKTKSRRLRVRGRRLSTNRILISRAELKHTNDKVIVTIYVYNRQKKYYFNKIIRIAAIENLLPNRIKIKTIKKKSLKIKSIVKKQKKIVWKTLGLFYSNNKADNNKFKTYETTYLKDYVTRSLRKEMLYIYLWQLVSFNESKFEKRYLLPLTGLVRKVYNKKVEFNLVNLKYLYLNSYIFSDTLVTKLRNRKNRLLRVLRTSLLMFRLPFVDRSALYEEIYNRKRKLQNLKVNTILKSIRNKSVSGIRLEVAGRLTRRNKAARSVFKLRYKGNIKNMDSSYKGLSTVLLRGYAKSNLQYTKLKSRIRIGSFGLKGWVSSS